MIGIGAYALFPEAVEPVGATIGYLETLSAEAELGADLATLVWKHPTGPEGVVGLALGGVQHLGT